MRINKYVAQSLHISRRSADALIATKRVTLNKSIAHHGDTVGSEDNVYLDGRTLKPHTSIDITVALHKPTGYVCSRNGQGAPTIYSLLPPQYQHLNYIGRLDKDSSGLLLLTSDGELNLSLSHPRNSHLKKYHITLNKALKKYDYRTIVEEGVNIDDGAYKSVLTLSPLNHKSHDRDNHYSQDTIAWMVSMTEGKNRQIRRTFLALGYTVTSLHRVAFGPFTLGNLEKGSCRVVLPKYT